MSLIYNLDRVNSVNQPNSKTRERTQNNKTIILATSQEIHVVIPGTKSVISMALIAILWPIVNKTRSRNLHLMAMKDSTQRTTRTLIWQQNERLFQVKIRG